MSSEIEIGYSCWGFLGDGIVHTPDGGRSHRLVLLNALIKQQARIIMLQSNRDLLEAGENCTLPHLTFRDDFPNIDALFLEYRWPIPGRNVGVPVQSTQYTPDVDRQKALLDHYLQKGIPILIWDKDQKLDHASQLLLSTGNVFVFEPALSPKWGRVALLFPIDEVKLQDTMHILRGYKKVSRRTKLIYIGNQYERDESFREFYERPSETLVPPAQVFGRWDTTGERTGSVFSHVTFHGRVGFQYIHALYLHAFSTVLIAPERYYRSGHYTQRLFESIWGGCIPLVPSRYQHNEKIVPPELVVHDAKEVLAKIEWLLHSSDHQITELLQMVVDRMEMFSARRQAERILQVIREGDRPE